MTWDSRSPTKRRHATTDEVAAAVRITSRHRLDMLLFLNPSSEITDGIILDAKVTRELLVALAVPEHVNRLHRGAVVIRGDRIALAGVPVTWAKVVRRAAELATGVALAVDESTGEIRVVDRTGRVELVEVDVLADVLQRYALEAGRR